MKKLFFLLAVIFLASPYLSAQANKVVGFWLTEEETSQVQVYKGTDGKYYGRTLVSPSSGHTFEGGWKNEANSQDAEAYVNAFPEKPYNDPCRFWGVEKQSRFVGLSTEAAEFAEAWRLEKQ